MARFSPVFLVVAFVIALTYSSAPAFAQSLPQSLPADATGITDPVEHQAYLEALNTENTFTIDKFVTGYPQSSGLEKVLQHSIARYVDSSDSVLNYWASGEDKVLEFVQRLRESVPDDLRPLAAITALDAKRVSIGKNELLPQMCSDAQAGLKQLPGRIQEYGSRPERDLWASGRRENVKPIFYCSGRQQRRQASVRTRRGGNRLWWRFAAKGLLNIVPKD